MVAISKIAFAGVLSASVLATPVNYARSGVVARGVQNNAVANFHKRDVHVQVNDIITDLTAGIGSLIGNFTGIFTQFGDLIENVVTAIGAILEELFTNGASATSTPGDNSTLPSLTLPSLQSNTAAAGLAGIVPTLLTLVNGIISKAQQGADASAAIPALKSLYAFTSQTAVPKLQANTNLPNQAFLLQQFQSLDSALASFLN